jgi:hypothetical protein
MSSTAYQVVLHANFTCIQVPLLHTNCTLHAKFHCIPAPLHTKLHSMPVSLHTRSTAYELHCMPGFTAYEFHCVPSCTTTASSANCPCSQLCQLPMQPALPTAHAASSANCPCSQLTCCSTLCFSTKYLVVDCWLIVLFPAPSTARCAVTRTN